MKKNNSRFHILMLGSFLAAVLFSPVKAQWQQTLGSAGIGIHDIALANSEVYAGTSAGVLLSSDNGLTCAYSNTGLTSNNVRAMTTIGSYVFAGTFFGGGAFLSTDQGATWNAINNGLTHGWILAMEEHATDLYVGVSGGTAGGVFRTPDYGANWSPISTGLTAQYYYGFAFKGTDIYVGSEAGIFKTTNQGTSWTPVNNGLSTIDIHCLASNGPNILAGTNNGGIFQSTDNGATWSARNTGLTDLNVWSLLVQGSTIFAGTTIEGVFVSTNQGANWTATNAGLTDMSVNALASDGIYLYAGTDSGIFVRSLSNIVGLEANPQNLNTEIYWEPAGKKLRIVLSENLIQSPKTQPCFSLSNMQGQVLVQQVLTVEKTNLDISNFAAGIYLVSVVQNEHVMVRKIVLD